MKKVCIMAAQKTPLRKKKTINTGRAHFEMYSGIRERLTENPYLLPKYITWIETGIFQYDPETKAQLIHWKTTFHLPPHQISKNEKNLEW